jgi:predicted cupin superfamily sugar epimerase
MKKQDLIEKYNMIAHPEGGYYAETYRSDISINTDKGPRSASTAIMFMITKDSISHLHRLSSDEGWHFHLGSPLKLIEITPKGELIESIMGSSINEGHKLQHFVPARNWFASTSLGDFSLVGCTVSPGFDFQDFEMAKKNNLKNQFPDISEIIDKYCLD